MKLRGYQQAAVNAVYEHLRMRDDNLVAVLPTGAGKSLVLAQIASDAVSRWGGRVLILAHVKELLEQNAEKVRKLCPDIPVGLYSARVPKCGRKKVAQEFATKQRSMHYSLLSTMPVGNNAKTQIRGLPDEICHLPDPDSCSSAR